MMKKFGLFLFILLLTTGLALSLSACKNDPSPVASYVSTVTENGKETTFILTVDEKNGTFSIEEENGENRYSGSFTYTNGYLKLESKTNGTQYAILEGAAFRFFTPEQNPEPAHEHDYKVKTEIAGTCVAPGSIVYSCSICGKEKTETGAYGTHEYAQKSFIAGNCQTESVTVYVCKHCGDKRVVKGEKGEHSFGAEARDDRGCEQTVKIVRRCSVCGTTQEVETEEYGKHLRDENGVCTVCSFDRTGLCHRHEDENNDGTCDDCQLSLTLLHDLNEQGYAVEDDYLYIGAYPQTRSEISVETLLADGKTDPDTGYVRYQNKSYAVVEKAGVKNAFVVEPICFKKLTEDGNVFLSTKILDETVFLNPENIVTKRELVDSKLVTTYYNAKEYVPDGENNAYANVFSQSDLYAYLTDTLIKILFTEAQTNCFINNTSVFIPPYTVVEGSYAIKPTDYVRFLATGGGASTFFTSTAAEASDEVYVGTTSSIYEDVTTSVRSRAGVVPMIRLTIE